ncbi:MAG: MFS transporter [Victivallaceae bacterium]
MLSPRLIRRGMNISIWAALLWSFFNVTVTGALFTGLMDSLQLTQKQFGIVFSLGLFFAPIQIFGSYLQKHYFNRRRFYFVCWFIYYMLFLLLIVLMGVWFKIPPDEAFAVFLLIYAGVQVCCQLPNAVWLSWLGDLVPKRESNSYWSRRTGFAFVSTMAAGMILGKLADILGRDRPATYMLILGIGTAIGLITLFMVLYGVADPDPEPQPQEGVWGIIREAVSQKAFRQLTIFFGYQSFWAWITQAFIFKYLVNANGMNFSMFTINSLVAYSALISFVSAYFFRIVGDRYGRTPLLVLCSVVKAVEFALWGTMVPGGGELEMACRTFLGNVGIDCAGVPAGLFYAIPIFTLGGFVNMGLASSQMSLITSVGQKRSQSFCIACFSAIVALCGALTAFFSGNLYLYLEGSNWLTEISLTPFNIMALITGVGYLSSIFFLRKFREDGAAPTSTMVKMLLAQNPFRAVYNAHALAQPLSESNRVKMLRDVSNLANREIIENLSSPSSRVRDHALLAINNMSIEQLDEELFEAVGRLLDTPELGMQAMAARTLGRLHAVSALNILQRHAQSSDKSIAQSAIFALGMLGDKRSEVIIRSIINDPNELQLYAVAAEALSKIGGSENSRLIFRVFEFENYEVLRKQHLIALVRSLSVDKGVVHPEFEGESKLPGSEIEKNLKRFCEDEFWLKRNIKLNVVELLEDFDRNRSVLLAEKVLHKFYYGLGVFHCEEFDDETNQLYGCFAGGGKLRPNLFVTDSYCDVCSFVELKLWSQLKYNIIYPGEDRFILLALLLVVRNHLGQWKSDSNS